MYKKDNWTVLGLMSGTSLDGLDLALCHFYKKENKWEFNILEAETLPYEDELGEALKSAHTLSSEELLMLHFDYGKMLGRMSQKFLFDKSVTLDLIASHGHTIFHNPEKGYTLQIGSAQDIFIETKIPVVSDFRTLDVRLGGQGAPLVPIGDLHLFSEYDFCLNIGGFSNISYQQDKRLAFDICPANFMLNEISQTINIPFDRDGKIAASGHLHHNLLEGLNQIPFYDVSPPKSIGREWYSEYIHPILNQHELPTADLLRTATEHIAMQIAKVVNNKPNSKVLVTGGGAKNIFLMERLQELSSSEIIIPDEKIVDFKEALIFAFLGVLKARGENNCLASVTGASRDCSGGVLIQ